MKEIGYYFFNLSVMQSALPTLLSGLLVTIKVSGAIIGLGFSLGLVLAIVRTLEVKYVSKVVNLVIKLYVDLLRSTPYLVLVTLVYYGLGFVGINLSPFWATVASFGACLSAFAEEIFRAGIEAIDRGQIEASRSLGLTHLQTLRFVVLPWVIRISFPPFTNRSIAIVKAVSMASAITLPELMKQARHLQAVMANPTPLIQAAIIYVLLFFPLVRFSLFLERKMGREN